jgi:hypothetical protein
MTRSCKHLLHAAIALAIVACPASALADQDLRSPDAHDAASQALPIPAGAKDYGKNAATGDYTPAKRPSVQLVRVTDGRLDLGSAGIGAAAMLGLGVASLGAVLLVRQSHHERS